MTDHPSPGPAPLPDPAADFDEAAYLQLYPDIAAAVASGKRASGLEHYLRYGRAEGRHFVGRRDRWTAVRIGASAGFVAEPATAPPHAIEAVLPGNAGQDGFGPANNLAARVARSRRILCVNPDVFPKDPAWAARHTALIEAGGPASRLFGATLFYDDGSLMHGGMYLELDTGLAVRSAAVESRRFARVEHYGKGAPPDSAAFLRPRPVPAVSGAFVSVERDWFERLGGFSEDFVFGHYYYCVTKCERRVGRWQRGHRAMLRAIARAIAQRTEAIEL